MTTNPNYTDDSTAFQVNAAFGFYNNLPQQVEFKLYVSTIEKAREIAASFPKALKATPYTVDSRDGRYAGVTLGRANLVSNKNVGEVNETGIARYHKAMKTLAKLGYTVEWITPYTNSYRTQADFESAISGR